MVVQLSQTADRPQAIQWYELAPQPWQGSEALASEGLRELLVHSVRLRLRADVPLGSCLSGGLDSSSIVCLANRLLARTGDHRGQVTVTSCFDDGRYDEWRYAEMVVRRTRATAVRVWPSSDAFERDLARQLWYMDEPFDGTSHFSQWCAFDAAARAGLRVVLDGQGSDELFAGYAGGTYVALFTGLLRRRAVRALAREVSALHFERSAPPFGEMVLAVRDLVPGLRWFLPRRFRGDLAPDWAFLRAGQPKARRPRNLGEGLLAQLTKAPLPALLRYEDRNSMAVSIEARLPFLDHRLVEFALGLPDDFKIRRGLRKHLLRESMRGIIPEPVRARRDKMGFATPESEWLTLSGGRLLRRGIQAAMDAAPDLLDADCVLRLVDDVVAGRAPYTPILFRTACLGIWLTSARDATSDVAGPGANAAAGDSRTSTVIASV
jgi:asparagine synthase (glutamine-hydrolysing)